MTLPPFKRDRTDPDYVRLVKEMRASRAECKKIGAGNAGYDAAMARWTTAWKEFHGTPH